MTRNGENLTNIVGLEHVFILPVKFQRGYSFFLCLSFCIHKSVRNDSLWIIYPELRLTFFIPKSYQTQRSVNYNLSND